MCNTSQCTLGTPAIDRTPPTCEWLPGTRKPYGDQRTLNGTQEVASQVVLCCRQSLGRSHVACHTTLWQGSTGRQADLQHHHTCRRNCHGSTLHALQSMHHGHRSRPHPVRVDHITMQAAQCQQGGRWHAPLHVTCEVATRSNTPRQYHAACPRTIRKSMLSKLPQMMRGLVRYDPCHNHCSFTRRVTSWSPPTARSWLVINCFSCWNRSHR